MTCELTPNTQRFAQRFAALAQRHEGAFIPFVTLGDPDAATSLRIMQTLIDNGADALELGFPFSDPCADGVVVQQANHRALAGGVSTKQSFELVAQLRKANPDIPISVMVYANLVVAHGIAAFFKDAAASGIDAVLIPDIPVCMMLESELGFSKLAQEAGVELVLVAPPNAADQTLRDIAQHSQGYTYMLSHFGQADADHRTGRPQEVLQLLKQAGSAPIILGFGISEVQQVQEAMAAGAAGVLVGVAIIDLIAQNLEQPERMLQELAAYAQKLKAATLPR